VDTLRRPVLALCAAAIAAASGCGGVHVRDVAELRAALPQLRPGQTLLLAPGVYRGPIRLDGLRGRAGAPIVIASADPDRPALFDGGEMAFYVTRCSYLTLRGITIRRCRQSGINVDGGDRYEKRSDHIVIEDVTVLETGPKGNHDALKLAGVDDFLLRRCRFVGWGGSAIDMVGCRRGVIADCTFLGAPGFRQANAVQIKGGSEDVLVQACFFRDAGRRTFNIGGSTALRFFRSAAINFEARRVAVAGNRIVGSETAIAWVTADGGTVHHNTIYLPTKWVGRILQETAEARFPPCRGGRFEHNLVVYDKRVAETIGVGPGTAPATFRFRRNAWYAIGGAPRPRLPVAEGDGVFGVDPKLAGAGTAEMTVTNDDPRLVGIGADAYLRPPGGGPRRLTGR